MATHIIHKQKVVLHVPAQQDAFSYQGMVSSMFSNGLQTTIENMLDEIAAPGEVVRIDTLNVDLGTIDAKQFDAGFKVKLVEALKEAVLKSRAGSVNNNGTTVAETKPAATSQQDAFIYFVLHGSLPWYSNARNMQAWEDDLLTQWQPADWKLVANWLQANHQQGNNVLQRLVWQFSSIFLAQLAMHLYISKNNAGSLTADTIQALHSDMAGIASSMAANSATEASADAWVYIFEILLSNNKSGSIDNFIARVIVTQLLRTSQAAVAIAVSNKAGLLLNVKASVVRNALNNIMAALQKHQPLGMVASRVFNGKDINPGDAYIEDIQQGRDIVIEIGSLYTGNNTVGRGASIDNSKSAKATTPPVEDVLYLDNCGLVLLHPFLGAYFSDIGLIEKKHFISKEAQQRAVLLLHYLGTGETGAAEFNLGLQKLLCGYGQEDTLPSSIELGDKEKYESEQLLRTVIDYWPPLKNTSVAGFQQTFLQRQGRLSVIDSGWLLRIEQKAVDILLGKLPWGYSTIKLPWMAGMLTVDWA